MHSEAKVIAVPLPELVFPTYRNDLRDFKVFESSLCILNGTLDTSVVSVITEI